MKSAPLRPPVDLHSQLLAALGEFDAAVAAVREGVRADFQARFRRLDELTAQLPAAADPQLRHFLEQKSYAKARALLAATRPA